MSLVDDPKTHAEIESILSKHTFKEENTPLYHVETKTVPNCWKQDLGKLSNGYVLALHENEEGEEYILLYRRNIQ